MWKRSFRGRLPSKSKSGRYENEAVVGDFPQKIKKWKMWERNCRGRLPSKSESGWCENETVVRDFRQKVKVEDVRAKLSCETSLKKWKWKMWKRSCCARLPSKSESGRCENEAFVGDFLQNQKVEDMKTKLSWETSLKKWKWKMWERNCPGRLPSNFESSSCDK